jgi:hypothetical protein
VMKREARACATCSIVESCPDGVSRYHLNYLPNDMKPSCPPGAQPHRSKNLHGTHVEAAPPDSAFTSTFIKPQSANQNQEKNIRNLVLSTRYDRV